MAPGLLPASELDTTPALEREERGRFGFCPFVAQGVSCRTRWNRFSRQQGAASLHRYIQASVHAELRAHLPPTCNTPLDVTPFLTINLLNRCVSDDHGRLCICRDHLCLIDTIEAWVEFHVERAIKKLRTDGCFELPSNISLTDFHNKVEFWTERVQQQGLRRLPSLAEAFAWEPTHWTPADVRRQLAEEYRRESRRDGGANSYG